MRKGIRTNNAAVIAFELSLPTLHLAGSGRGFTESHQFALARTYQRFPVTCP